MINKKVNWLDMFPDEFFKYKNESPVCYMAYGPAEPHGVYNALGLDWYVTQHILELAAAANGGIVAPPFAWHIQQQQYYDWEVDCCGMGMSLSSSIPEELFLHNIIHHIRNIDDKGFYAGILISGHYIARLGDDIQLLCDFYKRRTGSPVQLYAASSDALNPGKFQNGGEHAGLCETSMLLYLKPELVDTDRLNAPLNVSAEIAGGNRDFSAYCAPCDFCRDGRFPSRDFGKEIVDGCIEKLGEIQNRLLDSYIPRPGYKAPSLLDTEDIWVRFIKLTHRYLTCTATRREAEEGIFPKFPGWEELGE